MKYFVIVDTRNDNFPECTGFNKIQEAHSFMVNRSRQLKNEFYYIAVHTKNGHELERLTGRLGR